MSMTEMEMKNTMITEEYYDYRLLLGLTDGFSSWRDGQWHDAGDHFMERRTVA